LSWKNIGQACHFVVGALLSATLWAPSVQKMESLRKRLEVLTIGKKGDEKMEAGFKEKVAIK